MARKVPGTVAPYEGKPECTWCTGKDVGILESDCFNSCVGMVLYDMKHKIGVVAHFSGSMGDNLLQAQNDVIEILKDVTPISPGLWKGWVFGGISLVDKYDMRDTVKRYTIPLMDTVRNTLRTNRYVPVNLPLLARQLATPRQLFSMKPNTKYKAPEMNLLKPENYESHYGVKLNLASGTVQWIERKL